MAKNNNSNKGWIAGAILGAVAGAAYALWRTPMSGDELRSKLARGPIGQRNQSAVADTQQPGFGDKILHSVEQTLAPIVGVNLGKTAGKRPAEAESAPDTAPFNVAAGEPHTQPQVEAPESYGTETIRAKRFSWGDPAPVTKPEPLPEAANLRETHPTPVPQPEPVNRIPDTRIDEEVRANRFAWGDPQPEAAGSRELYTPEMVEPMMSGAGKSGPVAAAIERELENEAANEQVKAAMEHADYGTQTIRAKRFGWGDPSPAAAGSRELPTPDMVEPTLKVSSVPPEVEEAVTLEMEVEAEGHGGQTPAFVSPTALFNVGDKYPLRQFPNLGGLEDN